MIIYDKEILNKSIVDIEQYLYTVLFFIKGRNILLDNNNVDIPITICDDNILVTLDNIDTILYDNKIPYMTIDDDKLLVDYFTIDNKILNSKYFTELIVRLLNLIEYERNVHSTKIYKYITNIANVIYTVVNNYRRFDM